KIEWFLGRDWWIWKIHSTRVEIHIVPSSYFPLSTAPSHKGKFIAGFSGHQPVICLSGRLHYYEGYSMWEVTFPIRLLGVLGIKTLVVSNASGGTNADFDSGDIVFIRDHINLFPSNPLRGQNQAEWGPRFPDMSQAYSRKALSIAKAACETLQLPFKTGVYTGFPGPNLETPAEYKYINRIGGDMVGMSTVPEVIVARHMDIEVMGISLVTNACFPPERVVETSVEDVLRMAHKKSKIFIKLVSHIIDQF
ncbi:UNVERIFIED_CONTAM: hypothetical protein GTU68_048668, partial [Idotea baltica]|nr:hypothetical protein [Idotea baltica]